eukprot:4205716-Karenia_brevis.AAC.1
MPIAEETIPKTMMRAFTQLLPHVDADHATFAFNLLLQGLCTLASDTINNVKTVGVNDTWEEFNSQELANYKDSNSQELPHGAAPVFFDCNDCRANGTWKDFHSQELAYSKDYNSQ